MAKIIGNTTATPNPRPDWAQMDEAKADYIKNKPQLGSVASKDEISKDDLSLELQNSIDKIDNIQGNQELVLSMAEEHLENEENPHKVTASQVGTYSNDEIDSLLGISVLNLLDSNNIKRWDVVHQSSAIPYSMYAGAVDLTDCELDGITGVLSLVKTNGTDANYVDFNYRNTVNLGDEFSVLLTAFIQSNIKNDGTNNPTQDSYVELNLGDCSIELIRRAEDASLEPAWNRSNFRVGVKHHYYVDGSLITGPARYSDLIPADITTALYNGKPTTEAKLGPDGVATTKIKSNSLSTSGTEIPVILDYKRDSGWKDLLISYKGGVLKVEDCKGNVLYTETLPSEMSFENVKPKVRIHSDLILMQNRTLDVFRLEMSSDYINKIHEHENKDVLDTITQEVVETAVEFKAHQSDTNNPHQVTTEQIGTLSKEEIVEKIDKASKGELNLLDSEHIKKWNIVRESDNPETPADTPYNHYAGAVDMTGQGIEGVTGMLAQLQTNSFTTYWTDFVYDGTVDLGINFSMLVTAFIKNYPSSDKMPNENTFVEVQLGQFSIRFIRAVYDMASGEDFDKLRLWLCMGGNPITTTDIITGWNTTPTTTLYDGHPALRTPLGDPHSSVMAYIREQCPAQNGHIQAAAETTCFLEDFGWKDFTIKVRNGVLSVLDANGNPFKFMDTNYEYTIEEFNLFEQGVTADMFNGITPIVRSNHETGVAVYNPQAVVRLELKVADGGCYMEPLSELKKSVEDLQASVTNIYEITNSMGTVINNLDADVSDANSNAESAVSTVNSFVEEYGPKMDTYATETFVTTKIAEAQLNGEDVDLSGYATEEQLNQVDAKASSALESAGEAASAAAQADSKAESAGATANDAFSMAETALTEVGTVGDFAQAFYLAGEVLTDTLLIYIGSVDNKTHFKSYIVNSSTTNVPVADSTFRGVRHPISILNHSADNIDYIIKITEVKPVCGRQWINCYSTDTQSWSGWVSIGPNN